MISRDELYDLVWSKPMTKLAGRFEVSGSYLARICTLLNVPRPPVGYWSKLEVGKAPPPTPLPPHQAGDPLHWTRDGEPAPQPQPRAPARKPRERKVRLASPLVHPLVREGRTHLLNGRPSSEEDFISPYKHLVVDVTSTRASLDKALGLASELFNRLEAAGHRVVIAARDAQLGRERVEERETPAKPRDRWEYSKLWAPMRPTVVYVGTVAIGLSVVEMTENAAMRYVDGKYHREGSPEAKRAMRLDRFSWVTNQDIPTGRMRLIAYSPHGQVAWSTQWQESKSATLQGQLAKIVEEIEAAAPEIVVKLEQAAREAEVRRREWEEEQERRRRAEDKKQIAQSITDSETDLRRVIDHWSELAGIERFLAGVEERAAKLPGEEKQIMADRLGLARAFLGDLDPLDHFRNWKTPAERYKPKYE